jgi:hypothetical protein
MSDYRRLWQHVKILLIVLKLGDNKHKLNYIKVLVSHWLAWPYIEDIHQWNKNNMYKGNVLDFKFPWIMRYILNIWRKVIKYPNTHTVHSFMGNWQVCCGLIKVIWLSHTCDILLRIWNKQIPLFDPKQHEWENILWCKRQNSQLPKQISARSSTPATHNDSYYVLLLSKYL